MSIETINSIIALLWKLHLFCMLYHFQINFAYYNTFGLSTIFSENNWLIPTFVPVLSHEFIHQPSFRTLRILQGLLKYANRRHDILIMNKTVVIRTENLGSTINFFLYHLFILENKVAISVSM